jgi:hypothetical protein
MSPRGDGGDRGRARELVQARLGRRPQDRLEAAVVLEAWAGARPGAALTAGATAVEDSGGRPAPSLASPRQPAARDKAVLAEGLSLLIAVVAVALWTQPLGAALGTGVWDGAVRTALPLTLGLQWLLRSRYLGRQAGLALLRRQWPAAVGLVALVVPAAIVLGPREEIAALLVLIWVGGTVVVRRGWAFVYVVVLVGVAVAVNVDVRPAPVLGAAAAVIGLFALFAVAVAGTTTDEPGRMGRALAAGLMGTAIGGLLVLDTSIGWGTTGAAPALALVPSTVGSFWGGYHLWRFHDEVPRALAGVPVAQADRVSLRGSAMGVLGGAFGRLIGVTAVLSAAAFVAGPWVSGTAAAVGSSPPTMREALERPLHAPGYGPLRSMPAATYLMVTPRVDALPAPPALYTLVPGAHGRPFPLPVRAADPAGHDAGRLALLAGFGLVALATLLISLLQSLGFPSWALFTLACALAAEVALTAWPDPPVTGTALVGGALTAVLLALPPVISLFLRPGRVLATTLWIA